MNSPVFGDERPSRFESCRLRKGVILMTKISKLIIFKGDKYEGSWPSFDDVVEKVNEIIDELNRRK